MPTNRDADSDTLIVSQNVDMWLTGANLTIGLGATPIGYNSIELAELTGGVNANVLDATGFGGNATLDGLGGEHGRHGAIW